MDFEKVIYLAARDRVSVNVPDGRWRGLRVRVFAILLRNSVRTIGRINESVDWDGRWFGVSGR
jgi:hypothetical protein